jgi:hypothetical protein
MDTVIVAVIKDSKVIDALVFGSSFPESEIMPFIIERGGTSFQILTEDEIIVDGAIENKPIDTGYEPVVTEE